MNVVETPLAKKSFNLCTGLGKHFEYVKVSFMENSSFIYATRKEKANQQTLNVILSRIGRKISCHIGYVDRENPENDQEILNISMNKLIDVLRGIGIKVRNKQGE